MLTTLGSICFAICANACDKGFCVGCAAGKLRGVASPFCPSFPFTSEEINVPIKMPTVSVARILNVYTQRLAFMRIHIAPESICLPSSKTPKSNYYTYLRKETHGEQMRPWKASITKDISSLDAQNT